MEETATRPYNLRSREVVELPVQLQLSDDIRFMSDLLTSDRTDTGQVYDSESSTNDSDCEVLINSPSSKTNSSSGVNLSDKKSDSNPTASHSDSVSQQVINMQTLNQLQSLGRR